MPGRRRLVLDVSAELYRRMEGRATEERVDLDEWHLRTLIVALLPPPDAALLHAQDELRALRIVREIMEGGRPHAAHI